MNTSPCQSCQGRAAIREAIRAALAPSYAERRTRQARCLLNSTDRYFGLTTPKGETEKSETESETYQDVEGLQRIRDLALQDLNKPDKNDFTPS